MYQSEVGLHLLNRRRFPRLFLLPELDEMKAIPGMSLQWSLKLDSQILGISYSGLLVSRQDILSKMKVGQYFEAKLKFKGHSIPLKLRILKLTTKTISLLMDSISSEGRLKLDQLTKEELITENVRRKSTALLHPLMQAPYWWNAPFDTNIFLWPKEDESGLEKVYVEYDSLLIQYIKGQFIICKSHGVSDETKGYAGTYLDASIQKVSMGTNLLDRFLRFLAQLQEKESSELILKSLERLIRSVRES